MRPLISVVMSVYNEPENYLKGSIESVLKQTYTEFEFIIILDNPDYRLAREIVEGYAGKDNRIKIIKNKANEGLASSLNKAFSASRGEYIARMDADDISLPQRLERQLDLMERKPDISLIGSSIMYMDEKRDVLGLDFAPRSHNFLKRLILYGGTPCFHPTWFFRRNILDRIAGYRNMPTSQDYDFLMRLLCSGLKVSNIEEPLLYYRIHFNKISARKNMYQLKLTRYIMRAARAGFLEDSNKFSTEAINRILKTPKMFAFLHELSLHLFTFAYRFKRGYKKPIAYILFLVSFLISPYQLYHVFYCFIIRPVMLFIRR